MAVIWGIIIYKVVAALSGDDDTAFYPAAPVARQKVALNDYAWSRDTATLTLNYPDPFGADKTIPALKDTQQIPLKKLIQVQTPSARTTVRKPVINWNIIRYSGFIRNPHSKKLLALITMNGKSLMLSEGETAGELKLLKNLRDSIKVSYHQQTAFIPVNPGS
ncbi:hypothetical protein [Mucilaginibacter sp. PAMB04168]|uniref:hypothetical protein n=1 Tax=Mucilaginibacter sp. PAMB04168 TaxID=3138567 RepID=UPI0031F67A86